jgi:hypothetical protein
MDPVAGTGYFYKFRTGKQCPDLSIIAFGDVIRILSLEKQHRETAYFPVIRFPRLDPPDYFPKVKFNNRYV